MSPNVKSGSDCKDFDCPKVCKANWRFWKFTLFRKKCAAECKASPRANHSTKEEDYTGDSDISPEEVGSNSFVVITVTTVDASDDPPNAETSLFTGKKNSSQNPMNETVIPSQNDSCLWLGNCLFLE